jgi:hypothetical protein
VIAAGLLVLAAGKLQTTHFDAQDPGIHNNTVSVFDAFVDGHPARDNGRPITEVLPDVPSREDGRRPVVWIGNSHQHAVNDRKPGDTVSSVYLHRELNGERWPGRTPVFGISFPNLDYQEQFLLTLTLVLLPEELRPKVIVNGVRFHDAREMGIRSQLRPLLELPAVRAWLTNSAWKAGHEEAFAWMQDSLRQASDEHAAEEGLEPWLVRSVGPYIPIFNRRDLIYATAIQSLHDGRDRLFRIDTRSKRAILEPRYKIAMQYLDAAAAAARAQHVAMLLYNAPLRPEADNPYVPDQYARFRQDLLNIGTKEGIAERDYDDLIPRELWGTWYATDYPDFSHFTSAGHRILAHQVALDIADLLDDQSAHALQ